MLLGLQEDGRAALKLKAVSINTPNQLFLEPRFTTVGGSVATGMWLPLPAEDLLINCDDGPVTKFKFAESVTFV